MKHGAWYNVFLPYRYNDGSSIEAAKFLAIQESLIQRFGGLTRFEQPLFSMQGSWTGFGFTQTEDVKIYGIFSDDINSAREFLEHHKRLWQSSDWLDQEILFMTESAVEVL